MSRHGVPWLLSGLFVVMTGCGGKTVFTMPPIPVRSQPAPNLATARHEDAPAATSLGGLSGDPLQSLDGTPFPGDYFPELPVSRLESQSCSDYEEYLAVKTQSRIATMREELAEEYRQWKSEQPACAEERPLGNLWGDEIGDAFGTGGLGLSGIGEGGGGSAAGSVGSFGSGHGRLGGSHMAIAGEAKGASSTNLQVQGVDEADLVKHDGKYVYFAVGGGLRIASVAPPRLISMLPLAGTVREMFVEGSRAVVYVAKGRSQAARCAYGYDCTLSGDGTRTEVVVVGLQNRWAPRVLRRFELSGALVAARRIGSAVHTVVVDEKAQPQSDQIYTAALPRCAVGEVVVRARLERARAAYEKQIREAHRLPTITSMGRESSLCQTLWQRPDEPIGSYTSVVSFDMTDLGRRPTSLVVRSRPGTVYASSSSLTIGVRVASEDGSPRKERTELHQFRIGAEPSTLSYLASGVVPGRLLNQFSMDEWGGHLRVASTTGRVPDPRVESQVVVLRAEKGTLQRVGRLAHLAPGEDIRSVRFDEDRGYVVTFKKTDPLFALDLADPEKPAVLGELKIPGFSTYLHRIDENHLLSIGFDADDQGTFAYFNGLLLQLFDVTTPTEPRLLFREKIGTRGSGSEAAMNHLAFNYLPEQGLLGIPVGLCEGGGNGRMGSRLAFAGLLVYDVSLTEGFSRRGAVSHGLRGSSCQAWWSNSTSAVKRSLFIDDQVWSIAMDRAKVQSLSALGRDIGEVRFN
jgi:hypothetical protein